jgi:GTP-binding protein HflX
VSSAILVALHLPHVSEYETNRSIAELEQLVRGLGILDVTQLVQKRQTASPSTYVGRGKLQELVALTRGPGTTARGPAAPEVVVREDLIVVVDDELTAAQHRTLESALGVVVLDRTAVILRVFEARARTREAQLELALARLAYELPRVRDDHSLGDREGGGGRAGRGHSNVELAKRRIRERMAELRRDLDRSAAVMTGQRRARADQNIAALVGYTNVGKSSLMRALTGSDVLVEDKLFATLGTTVRLLQPAVVPRILVADTVGFIHKLPHGLVASFRSTLAEARDAALLVIVVDAADSAFRDQLRVTESVLADIGASETPRLLVLNKIDRVAATTRAELAVEWPDAFQMTVFAKADVATLHARIAAHFATQLVEAELEIPYARQGAFAQLRNRIHVVREEYGEALSVTVRAPRELLHRLRELARD